MTPAQLAVEQVFALYQQFGTDDYIGEPVSQLEHMSQAAHQRPAAGAVFVCPPHLAKNAAPQRKTR